MYPNYLNDQLVLGYSSESDLNLHRPLVELNMEALTDVLYFFKNYNIHVAVWTC